MNRYREMRFLVRMALPVLIVLGMFAWYAWTEWFAAFQENPLLVGGGTFALVAGVVGGLVAMGIHDKKRQEAWAKAQEDESDQRTV